MKAELLQIDGLTKKQIFTKLREEFKKENFHIAEEDSSRPWGGYFKFESQDVGNFSQTFFPNFDLSRDCEKLDLSPKILLIEPFKRLSWQVHTRRAEHWRVLKGPVGVFLSETDTQPDDYDLMQDGRIISFAEGVRHRLVGLNVWGIVAEFWQHIDSANPSDEADIRRIQDDFSR